jgi:hypothetical protein
MSGNSVGLYGSTSTANVAGGNVTSLYQQTQAVEVDNGYNNADVQAFLEQYTGNIQCGNIDVLQTATINAVFTDNLFYANGTPYPLDQYGNANVAAFLPTYTGNLAGGNLTLTTALSVGQDIVATGNITTGQNLTTGGNIQAAGNIRTTGAAGNITGAQYIVAGFFVGDGSQLSNISGSYGNANVADYLASGTNTANIVTTGNISGTYILGNGSQLTGLPATYSDANVTTLLANFGSNSISTTGNITAGLFTGSGAGLSAIAGANVTGQVANALVAGTVYTAAQPNITSVGTLSTLSVAGNISANNISSTGNVTVGGTLHSDDITSVGDVTVFGNQVITGNLTVQGNTTTINSNVITTNDKTITVANNQSTGANVNGAGIEAGNPAIATWLYNDPTTSWQSNISVTPSANLTQDLGTNTNRWATMYAGDANISANVTAVGNISGNYILGNGSQLTGLPEVYGNANVESLLANYTANINTTGMVEVNNTVDPIAVTITGRTDHYGDVNIFAAGLSVGGIVTADGSGYFAGSGSNLTNLPGANVTGTVASATQANTANVANAVAGGNVSGQVANALVAGTVYTNAQPNITSVGTLSSLSVTGNITSSANIAGSFFIGNGSQLTGLPEGYSNANVTTLLAAFGSNTIVTTGNISAGNFTGNAAGLSNITGANVVGAVANATFATTAASAATANTVTDAAQANITSVGTLTSLAVTGNITSSANIAGSFFIGNGSQLTGLPATYGNANVANFLANFGSNNINTTGIIATLGSVVAANIIANNISGTISTATQPNITSVGTLSSLTVSGNIGTGGINTDNYRYANGTPISFGGTYGDSNVTTLLASLGSNTISSTANITTTANVSGAYVIGNGSTLSSITGANVVGAVANATYATSAGTADSATTATTVTGNAQANITSLGTLTGLSVTGNTSTGGILTDNYYYANGTPISFGGSYGNAEVSAYLASGTNTANIVSTGNISGGNLLGVGSGITGINAFGNIVIAGQTTVSADNTTDSLTLVAGTNITLTTDAANNTITITSTAAGGGETLSPFLLMGG